MCDELHVLIFIFDSLPFSFPSSFTLYEWLSRSQSLSHMLDDLRFSMDTRCGHDLILKNRAKKVGSCAASRVTSTLMSQNPLR